MEYITVRFIATPGFVTDAIKLITWSDIDHVEFVLEDGTFLGAHSDGGISIRPIGYCKPTKEYRYKVFVTDYQKSAISKWARQQIGEKYDFANIAGILFHNYWTEKHTYICSVFVAAAFKQAGINLLNWPANIDRLTPRDVMLSPYLIPA